MESYFPIRYVALEAAVATVYQDVTGAQDGLPDAQLERTFNRVAQALALVVPVYVSDAGAVREVAGADLLDCTFLRGAKTLLTTRGVALSNLKLRRADIPEAVSVLKAARVRLRPADLDARSDPDLLDASANGGTIHEVLNVLVREARSTAENDTRIAIFIANPELAQLDFAAAAGLSDSYVKAVDGFKIGPKQPSCGKAAYTGEAVIVGDLAGDENWAPYLQLAQEHGIRACWSFPLRGTDGGLLGTFAMYHYTPCEPDARQYERVRYFSSAAALLIERHRSAGNLARQKQSVATQAAVG